jgi:Co/Zn/Cd efflux system component
MEPTRAADPWLKPENSNTAHPHPYGSKPDASQIILYNILILIIFSVWCLIEAWLRVFHLEI